MIDKALSDKVLEVYQNHFGSAPQRLFQAPGRVNLIGEHTDYNDGFVLPCAINYQTLVAVTPRDDNQVNVVSVDYGNQTDSFTLNDEITSHPDQMWSNYIRGVIKHLKMRGLTLGGADMVVSGNVPQGAGLSSSAALEVAIGETFRSLFELPISKQDVALNGQEAENQFVGCACGIMDQMVSATGAQNKAVLLDCRSLDTRLISMPTDLAIMIINSNVKRGLVDSEYNTRREQCEEAAAILGVKALRDVDLTQLQAAKDKMSDEVYRRALHVVTENDRTLKAAEALESGDVETLSTLMAQSHASMRDDFEITVKPIDYAVEILDQYLGKKGGVRMTGGGFGGCIVALMPHDLLAGAQALLAEKYQAQTGIKETVYVCSAEDGTGEVK